MNKEQQVLHSPFDFKTHNETFICYCEVIILPDGTIEYAIPSHQEKLIEVYARNNNLTIDEVKDKFANDIDFFDKLMKETRLVLVWYEYEQHFTELTDEQKKSLQLLIDNGCISKTVSESVYK